MNVCKILDMTPGTEMSSWGTIHFPEEKRIIEWVVNVVHAQWRSLRYGQCERAPSGGFDEIREGHEELLAGLNLLHPKARAEMICKEGISEDQVIRLVLAELQKAGFPYSLTKEANSLKRLLESCRTPVPAKAARRFQVD